MSEQERELKFDIALKDIPGFEAHPLLKRAESSDRKHQRSVYFDTDHDDLWEAGASSASGTRVDGRCRP